jgi:hypothetical protein
MRAILLVALATASILASAMAARQADAVISPLALSTCIKRLRCFAYVLSAVPQAAAFLGALLNPVFFLRACRSRRGPSRNQRSCLL